MGFKTINVKVTKGHIAAATANADEYGDSAYDKNAVALAVKDALGFIESNSSVEFRFRLDDGALNYIRVGWLFKIIEEGIWPAGNAEFDELFDHCDESGAVEVPFEFDVSGWGWYKEIADDLDDEWGDVVELVGICGRQRLNGGLCPSGGVRPRR